VKVLSWGKDLDADTLHRRPSKILAGVASLAGLDLSPSAFPALTSLCENSVVPPGLESFLPLYPALKRWAIGRRPSGADSQAFRSTGLPEN
jgi:hypothetical protein